MDTQISFKEMAKRGKEILARQGPISYEGAKAQVDRLRKGSYLRSMGMMFGGWAAEEDAKSQEEKAYDKGFSEGLKGGRTEAISRCQLAINQSLELTYKQKTELWFELERLR
jgi:hypothetical protein